MSATCFVDTNILVYVRDASEPDKQAKAEHWLSTLWRNRNGRLSFQVLNEYYVTVTQRLRPGLNRERAQADVRDLMVWNPVSVDRKIVEDAWLLQSRHGFSWWDALIVSAARRANCDYLVSEDFSNGQKLGGMTIVNPFVVEPDHIL